MRSWYRALAAAALACALSIAARADGPPPHDLLNATLWMQRSVEYKAHALGAFRARPHPARSGARRQELDGSAGGADGRLSGPAAGGRARSRRDAPRQLRLPGLDGHQRQDLHGRELAEVRVRADC